ncbi:MAG: NFACT RNA binding domain-containing protein, partial [Planctomycetota bacterium]
MSLNAKELRLVVDEISPELAESRLQKLQFVSRHSALLTFRGEETYRLLVTLDPRFARLHLVEEKPQAMPAPDWGLPFRSAFEGRRVRSVLQLGTDRVVEFQFHPRANPESDTADALVVELYGRRPDLIALSKTRRVVATLRPPERSRFERGGAYEALPPRSPSEGEALRFAGDSSVSSQIEVFYLQHEEESLRDEKREVLGVQVAREVKRRKRSIEAVEKDIAEAESRGRDREIGELLKGSMGQLKRGASRVEVVDYFDAGLPKIEVELDPARSPQENVELFFKRHRKSQRALEFLGARLEKLETELLELEDASERIASAVSSAVLLEIEDEISRFVRKKRKQKKAKQAGPLGPRKYVSRDGLEILVGRSAKQNDELSLKIARGNDLFLHVAGKPGAHVILRSRTALDVPPESLLDAAQLALYYSIPKRSSALLGSGAGGEVDYTPAKYVSKPKGAKPGAVLLARHKTI